MCVGACTVMLTFPLRTLLRFSPPPHTLHTPTPVNVLSAEEHRYFQLFWRCFFFFFFSFFFTFFSFLSCAMSWDRVKTCTNFHHKDERQIHFPYQVLQFNDVSVGSGLKIPFWRSPSYLGCVHDSDRSVSFTQARLPGRTQPTGSRSVICLFL